MGRPKKEIDEKLVAELAGLRCSLAEIARVVGCAVSTLQRRFDQALKRGHEQVKTSIKRKQFEVAMGGNPALLIWLGKILVGQSEKVEEDRNIEITVITQIVDLRNERKSKKEKGKRKT